LTTVTLGESTHADASASTRPGSDPWRIVAMALLSVRFIQGFIYWGGGSRRFIYAPSKLDPHAASRMANKLQSARHLRVQRLR
jgi:thiosulfate dehydrogenase [quinone] large subunit